MAAVKKRRQLFFALAVRASVKSGATGCAP
jgi:hypothetical protein